MRSDLRLRYRLEATLAAVSFAVLALTLAWPAWIEGTFGVDPDAGSGAAEWAICWTLLALATASSALARRDRRMARVTAEA